MENEEVPLIANNDTELFSWLSKALSYGGGFINSVATVAFNADSSNYKIIRPALLDLKAKYPKYSEKDGVDITSD